MTCKHHDCIQLSEPAISPSIAPLWHCLNPRYPSSSPPAVETIFFKSITSSGMGQTRSKPLVFPSDSGMKIHLIPSAFASHSVILSSFVKKNPGIPRVWRPKSVRSEEGLVCHGRRDEALERRSAGGKIPRKSVKSIVLWCFICFFLSSKFA